MLSPVLREGVPIFPMPTVPPMVVPVLPVWKVSVDVTFLDGEKLLGSLRLEVYPLFSVIVVVFLLGEPEML